jgi:hypothetical protein
MSIDFKEQDEKSIDFKEQDENSIDLKEHNQMSNFCKTKKNEIK